MTIDLTNKKNKKYKCRPKKNNLKKRKKKINEFFNPLTLRDLVSPVCEFFLSILRSCKILDKFVGNLLSIFFSFIL